MIGDAIVLACILYTAWGAVQAIGRAGDTLERAPWPQPRLTPEPRRLRLVRPGPYDWQREVAS